MSGSPILAVNHDIEEAKPRTSFDGRTLDQIDNYFLAEMSLDFIAGCLGGCAGVLVGHPLDTVKVHIQTQNPRNPKYHGVWHCMKSIVAENGVRGLYRGMSSPMVGIGFVNAIVFGIYGNVQRHTEDPNSLYSHFLAGSVAGFLQSIVCTPMELAKTRTQLQHKSTTGVHHKSPYDCLRNIIRIEGVRGVFKGLGITALRDVPGFASYFVSYEYMMRLPSSPNAMHTLIAGGFAGIFSWLACYPTDVIKTCLQADGMNSSPQYTGIIDCMRKGYKADGYHFFFRGLNSTLIRAFPMNAACFFVVSCIMKFTRDTNLDLVVQSGDPLTIVGVDSEPYYHVHKYNCISRDEDIDRKRFILAKSLKALGAFNEAICQSDVEELASEFYPHNSKYYLEDDRLNTENTHSVNLEHI